MALKILESSTMGGIDVIKLTFKLYYGISTAGWYLHDGICTTAFPRRISSPSPQIHGEPSMLFSRKLSCLLHMKSQKEGGEENIRSRVLAFKWIIRIIVWDTQLSVATALWDRER